MENSAAISKSSLKMKTKIKSVLDKKNILHFEIILNKYLENTKALLNSIVNNFSYSSAYDFKVFGNQSNATRAVKLVFPTLNCQANVFVNGVFICSFHFKHS